MPALITNNAASRLASTITGSSTSLSVTSGEGAKFPSPGAGEWFPVTLLKSDGSLEIVRCTARSGDVLTVTRGQEGTSAQAFSVGDRVELRLTAAAIGEFAQASAANTFALQQTFNNGFLSKSGVALDNGTSDSPDIVMRNPTSQVNIDVNAYQFRIASVYSGGALKFPFIADLSSDSVYAFGNSIWHSGNFNPSSKLDTGATAANSNALGGTAAANFPRRGAAITTAGMSLVSGEAGGIAGITGGANTSAIISNSGNTFASALITFLRDGAYGVHFGVDVDNKLKVGGWSMGGVAYEIAHGGNFAAITSLVLPSSIAAMGTGTVGTYAFLRNNTGSNFNAGDLIAGANTSYASHSSAQALSPGGTWRVMGYMPTGAHTVCLRIS